MKRIGIDIGGTTVKLGVVADGRVTSRRSFAMEPDTRAYVMLEKIADICTQLMRGETDAIEGVGVGCPGLIDSRAGVVRYANNFCWENVELTRFMRERLGIPSVVANDARAAALGEAIHGAGKGFGAVAMLTLGTGVGGGYVRGGRLDDQTPFDDAGAMWGHTCIEPDGRPCTCGRRGCLEAYASATALRQQIKQAYGKNFDVKELFERHAAGEAAAAAIVEDFLKAVCAGAVNMVNAVRPEVLVLGGGIMNAAYDLTGCVSEAVKNEAFAYRYAPTQVLRAQLGNDAGIIGAAELYV